MMESQSRCVKGQGGHKVEDFLSLTCCQRKTKGELQNFAKQRRSSFNIWENGGQGNEQC